MNELSTSAALLLETSGVLYGLLLAYYAFSLGRAEAAGARNWARLGKWMSGEVYSIDPRPDSKQLTHFTEGARNVYARRIDIARLLCMSSILFLSTMLVAGLQVIAGFPKEWGDLIVSLGSFTLLVGVPAVFTVATFYEYGHAKRQLEEMWTEIWNSSASFLSGTELEKFQAEWNRRLGLAISSDLS